jgi:Fe-S-cluster containining protein
MSDAKSESFTYHSPIPMEAEKMVTANMKLNVKGVTIETSVPVPAEKTTLRIMLPVLRAFTEAFVRHGMKMAEEAGQGVSCRDHCGACCRQLVPILEAEAYQLKELTDSMPEEQRKVVLERFSAAKARLESTGMWERAKAVMTRTDDVDLKKLGREYLLEGVACPFLEDESCSIHPERPLICREYLVASDPKHCAQLSKDIVPVRPLAEMSSSAAMTNDDPPGSRGRYVPLVMLLEWAAEHPEPPPTHTGKELLTSLITQLARKRVMPDAE